MGVEGVFGDVLGGLQGGGFVLLFRGDFQQEALEGEMGLGLREGLGHLDCGVPFLGEALFMVEEDASEEHFRVMGGVRLHFPQEGEHFRAVLFVEQVPEGALEGQGGIFPLVQFLEFLEQLSLLPAGHAEGDEAMEEGGGFWPLAQELHHFLPFLLEFLL